jgi:hypothetical protein
MKFPGRPEEQSAITFGNPNCRWRKRGIEMNSCQLRREKELLLKILDLAECQTELMESGRLEDLEILLSLRVGPLAEMANMEEAAEIEPDPALTASTDELRDLNELNLEILTLVGRIVGLDEKTEWLADLSSAPTELSTKTVAYLPD